MTGAKHMYASGKGLRDYLMKEEGFLSRGYHVDEVYVQTTIS